MRHCLVISTLFLCIVHAFPEEHQIDLSRWGYATPRVHVFKMEFSQLVSVGANMMVVGFVSRDHQGLSTRSAPPLSLHILEFDFHGSLINQTLLPTTSWTGNALVLTKSGQVLARTGDKLLILSPELHPVAQLVLSPAR